MYTEYPTYCPYVVDGMLLFGYWLTGDLLHELSNDGARNQFQDFVEEYILPVMVSAAKVSFSVFTHYP